MQAKDKQWNLEPQKSVRAFVKWFMVPAGTLVVGWMVNSVILGFTTIKDVSDLKNVSVPKIEATSLAAAKKADDVQLEMAGLKSAVEVQTSVMKDTLKELRDIRNIMLQRRTR